MMDLRPGTSRSHLSLPAAGRAEAEPGLPGTTIGINQILWANDDLPELTPPIDPLTVLDEMHRLGYGGSQLGREFPRGAELRRALAARDLRIAEVYAALECGPDGPSEAALRTGRAKLADLHDADGDVLVAALPLTPDRIPFAGRADRRDVPRLSEPGIQALARLLEVLGREAAQLGHRLAFHPHAGTYIETPDEVDRLFAATDPTLVGVCLDVGHHLVGGGDPVAAIKTYGERVRHVHLKDVDGAVLSQMRDGTIAGFLDALRARIFSEIGSGVLDVVGVLAALADLDYRGWIVVEQDTTWRAPSESAAISMSVIRFAIRELAGGRARGAR